jgi:hypothetical protein
MIDVASSEVQYDVYSKPKVEYRIDHLLPIGRVKPIKPDFNRDEKHKKQHPNHRRKVEESAGSIVGMKYS